MLRNPRGEKNQALVVFLAFWSRVFSFQPDMLPPPLFLTPRLVSLSPDSPGTAPPTSRPHSTRPHTLEVLEKYLWNTYKLKK